MRSVDNNKTTVCHLAIPKSATYSGTGIESGVGFPLSMKRGDRKVTVISLSQGGLKIPRSKELAA